MNKIQWATHELETRSVAFTALYQDEQKLLLDVLKHNQTSVLTNLSLAWVIFGKDKYNELEFLIAQTLVDFKKYIREWDEDDEV